MVNLFYDSYRILSKVYGEKTFIPQAISSEVIEPINKNAVIKICYGVVENDIYLEYLISKLCDKRPKLPIRILLKISIYSIKFLNKMPYTVTDNAVELCKKLGKGGMSGFLNAILRKYIKAPEIPLPTNVIERLSVCYSFPAFAVKELINDYGAIQAEKIMHAATSSDNVYTFLRFREGHDGNEYLQKLGKDYLKTPFKSCFALTNFVRDDGFFDGKYTFQSVGSVAICDVIDRGETLLDTCAAPGGKSIALTEKFNNVIACELHPHRVKLIDEYAKRMNVSNIEIFENDATVTNESFINKFDAVLCDVPCSGFGVTKDNPDIKINREYESLTELNSTQLKILETSAKYLKKGGYLYYSTCSIFKRENEELVQKFLDNNDNFEPVDIVSPLNHLKTAFGLQFLPDISMGAGFYVCKMKKL